MPGNRQVYEQAMNTGHSAAWDQDWQTAIGAYGRAIQEFPTDAEAHLHLGLGLMEIGRLEDALKVYLRAQQLAPQDPVPLEKRAETLERMGRLRDAAQQYVNAAEVYLSLNTPDIYKAIDNWERATHLTPGLIAIHARLAQAYKQIGDKKKATHQYLTLAYNFQRTGDSEKAVKAAQAASKIDKSNTNILNIIQALEAGRSILPPTDEGISARTSVFDKDVKPARGASNPLQNAVVETSPHGPIGEATLEGMSILAIAVMEGEAGDAMADVLQAMEAQRQGDNEAAAQAYNRAARSVRIPSLKLNLGATLLYTERYEEALKHLPEVMNDPSLGAGALHAIGMAYHHLGREKQAARYLLQSLQMVDSSLHGDMLDYDAPKSIYQELVELTDGLNDESIKILNDRFQAMLEGKEWKQRIADKRRQLEDTMREQGAKGVLEILLADGGDQLAQSVATIDRYMRQNLYTLAMDEAHRAIEVSPYYLPVHVRMAEIMMKEGRVRNAIQKYNVIAKTFLSRGENERAANILTEVLELAPLDVSVRESLIELLESESRWDEALTQYIDLADTYHQLGNFDQSRDTYSVAERIAQREGAAADKVVRIKHRIADIDQMRLDLRKAQRTYEEIIQIAPDDERAHRMLVDLNYRQGNPVEGVRRLDKLLSVYAKARQVNKILQILEEFVTIYPSDTGLRTRLASIYRQLGRVKDAIVQLDALGELQLEAGLNKEAANTIRQIMALNPGQAEEYRRLLVQLGG
jgi:tetratricopeptide (TPR) repeat protein